MCNFCNGSTVLNLTERNFLSNTNLEEHFFVDDRTSYFNISLYTDTDRENSQLNIGYNLECGNNQSNLSLFPFAYFLQINYCPFCGREISKNKKMLEDYPEHILMIEEKK